MDSSRHLSEVTYVGLCCKIGTPTEVTIRRDVRDIEEMIETLLMLRKGEINMLSGSFRDGFRFESSDRDIMYWDCDHILINDISHAGLYDRTKHTIILMEDNDTPPGFVKLQLLASPPGGFVTTFAVLVNDRFYISSLAWQQSTLNSVQSNAKCS